MKINHKNFIIKKEKCKECDGYGFYDGDDFDGWRKCPKCDLYGFIEKEIFIEK